MLLWCVTLVNSAILAWVVTTHAVPAPVPGPDGPPNPPAADAVKVGHGYGVTLAKTYASAWRKAADDVDAGKSIDEAQSNLQSAWEASRVAEGTKQVTPMFAAIIPEGSEGDSTSRPKWTATARQFATGLESVK